MSESFKSNCAGESAWERGEEYAMRATAPPTKRFAHASTNWPAASTDSSPQSKPSMKAPSNNLKSSIRHSVSGIRHP